VSVAFTKFIGSGTGTASELFLLKIAIRSLNIENLIPCYFVSMKLNTTPIASDVANENPRLKVPCP